MQVAFEMCDDADLETEKQFFGSGPPQGSQEAAKSWFSALAEGNSWSRGKGEKKERGPKKEQFFEEKRDFT